MRKYEITFITKEDAGEKPVKTEIESLDGKIVSTSSIGEKQFVYRIKKENKGFYTTVVFEIEPTKIVDLEKKLSLKEDILRFLLISDIITPRNEAPAKAKEEAEEKEAEKLMAEEAKEDKEEEIVAEPVKVEEEKATESKAKKTEKKASKAKSAEAISEGVKKADKKEKPAKKEEVKEPEMDEEDRLKALDKKLDELLKE